MSKATSLWLLPVAIIKWTMFSVKFERKQWDTCSYSVTARYVARPWSPTYWLRALFLLYRIGLAALVLQVQTEVNVTYAPAKNFFGHINHQILKPVRYVYFFVAIYTA